MNEILIKYKESKTKVFINGSEHRGEITKLTPNLVTIRYTQKKKIDKIERLQEEIVTFAINKIISVGTGMQDVNMLEVKNGI